MKKSIPSYMKTLSGNDFEILEELFEKVYTRFITFYWLINDYNDEIVNMTYKSKKSGLLKIEVEFSDKSDMKKIVTDLSSDNEDIIIKRRKNNLNIEISTNESLYMETIEDEIEEP